MNPLYLLCVLVPAVLATAIPTDSFESRELKSDPFSVLLTSCSKVDFTTCLGLKTVSLIGRAARSNNIDIVSGVSLVRDEGTEERAGRALSVFELENTLPEDSNERTNTIFDLFEQSVINFFKGRTLKFDLDNTARSLESGRGKMKKYILPLIAAAVAKIALVGPIILGGLALLVIKALIVAKLAFLLAAALGLPKLLGGLGGLGGKGGVSSIGGGSSGGWSSSGGPYYRSFDENAAQNIAYNAHAPTTTQ